MYIAKVPNRNSPPTILLRESVREGSKVRTKTIANLTKLPAARIEALVAAFRGDFDNKTANNIEPTIGQTFGTYFVLKYIADELGITKALGKGELPTLVSFLAMTRVAHRGSRLSAVRFAKQHAISDILSIDNLNEDKLYAALDYAAENQAQIEKNLYKEYLKQHKKPPALVLYDVTSSYFEGDKNELADYGYNRDGKKGKKQIVIGLLGDKDGNPLAIRVFEGNTSDTTTVTDQINKLRKEFGIEEVIFVGDRGMVKTKAQEELSAENYQYITALTDAQTRTLLNAEVIQLSLFDEGIAEIEAEDKRYILIKNNQIREQKLKRIDDKLEKLSLMIKERNDKVETSSRSKPDVGLKNISEWVKNNRLNKFVNLELKDKKIECTIDKDKKRDITSLYGCYTLVTDVDKSVLSKEEIKSSYKSLQNIEQDFKCLKTEFLEVRPIFVRKAERTVGHVFIAMLALKILRLMRQKLEPTTHTVEDAINALNRYVYITYEIDNKQIVKLPKPDAVQQEIFSTLGINFKNNNVGRK